MSGIQRLISKVTELSNSCLNMNVRKLLLFATEKDINDNGDSGFKSLSEFKSFHLKFRFNLSKS